MGAQLDNYSRQFIKKFGQRVRKMRHDHDWTLEDCEERGYKNWRHLQEVELGKKAVSLVTVIKVARMFKVHPSELLEGL
jgi:transcriptional regulator with XRE-family HTH domain